MEEDQNVHEEKIEKLYTHYLYCPKCHLSFSIESKESNNTKIGLRKMRCPVCHSRIQLDAGKFVVSGHTSNKNQSKMNEVASVEAMRMANEMKRADALRGDNEMIDVKSTQKGKHYGQTEKLPKSAVESIEKKVAPLIEE